MKITRRHQCLFEEDVMSSGITSERDGKLNNDLENGMGERGLERGGMVWARWL